MIYFIITHNKREATRFDNTEFRHERTTQGFDQSQLQS